MLRPRMIRPRCKPSGYTGSNLRSVFEYIRVSAMEGSPLAILVLSIYDGQSRSLSFHGDLETAIRLLGHLGAQRGAMGPKSVRSRTSIRSSPTATRPESGLLGKPLLGTHGVRMRPILPHHLSRRLRNSELQSKPISEDPRYLRKEVRQGLAVPRFRRCRSPLLPQWASTTTRLTRLERNKFDFRLIAFDFRAVGHVLNSPKYEKPWQTQRFLSRLIGQGVFAKEGHEHRWQVRKRFIVGSAVNVLTPVDGRDEYWHPRSTLRR